MRQHSWKFDANLLKKDQYLISRFCYGSTDVIAGSRLHQEDLHGYVGRRSRQGQGYAQLSKTASCNSNYRQHEWVDRGRIELLKG